MMHALGPLFVIAVAQQPVMPASTHGTCTRADLDGDGAIDHFDSIDDSCGTGGCVYRVTLATGKFVGTIDGLCSFRVEPRPGKLADIVATWRLGAVDEVLTRYRFDGRRYRARRR